MTLRREVSAAAAGAGTEQEFFTRLAESGVSVRRRYSTAGLGEVTGYAVGLAHHTAKGGGVIWYGGGKLAADLTLPKLRARWTPPGAEHGRFPGCGLSAAAARGVLRNMVTGAAEQAGDEAGFFACLRGTGVLVRARFSEIHPGQVTGYSVALPGHLDSNGAPLWYGGGRLSAGLTLPRLRRGWDQRPSTAAGSSGAFRFTAPERNAIFEHVARQAAAATQHIRCAVRSDPGGAAIALMANLAALAIAVAELRQAQQHAPQAAAARAAASHLHAAYIQARPPAPSAGQARARQPDRPANAAEAARRDFPAPARPGRAQPAGPGRSRPRPPDGPLPPRRAGPGR